MKLYCNPFKNSKGNVRIKESRRNKIKSFKNTFFVKTPAVRPTSKYEKQNKWSYKTDEHKRIDVSENKAPPVTPKVRPKKMLDKNKRFGTELPN